MSTVKAAGGDPREQRLCDDRSLLGAAVQQAEEDDDGGDEAPATARVASQPASGLAEARAQRRARTGSPASGSAGSARRGRARARQPFSTERSSAVAPGRRRRMATMMPRPTTTSAAATTRTKNTTTWPPMSSSARAEGHEGEVHGVEHELDAHEHHQRVAADQQADGADARRAWPPAPGTTSGVASIGGQHQLRHLLVGALGDRRAVGILGALAGQHDGADHGDGQQHGGDLEGEARSR